MTILLLEKRKHQKMWSRLYNHPKLLWSPFQQASFSFPTLSLHDSAPGHWIVCSYSLCRPWRKMEKDHRAWQKCPMLVLRDAESIEWRLHLSENCVLWLLTPEAEGLQLKLNSACSREIQIWNSTWSLFYLFKFHLILFCFNLFYFYKWLGQVFWMV